MLLHFVHRNDEGRDDGKKTAVITRRRLVSDVVILCSNKSTVCEIEIDRTSCSFVRTASLLVTTCKRVRNDGVFLLHYASFSSFFYIFLIFFETI